MTRNQLAKLSDSAFGDMNLVNDDIGDFNDNVIPLDEINTAYLDAAIRKLRQIKEVLAEGVE